MSERQYEEKHLAQTISLIENEEELLKNQQKELEKSMNNQLKEVSKNTINTATEESFYESVVEYRQHEHELALRYQSAEAKEKRMNTLETMAQSPYFARIDFKEEAEPKETLYLGIASLRDKKKMTRSSLTGARRSPIYIMKESLEKLPIQQIKKLFMLICC